MDDRAVVCPFDSCDIDDGVRYEDLKTGTGEYLWTEEHELITGPCAVKDIRGFVIAVLPEFQQAELRTRDGYRYALTEMTQGIVIKDLRLGTEYDCTVTVRFPRVLKASLRKHETNQDPTRTDAGASATKHGNELGSAGSEAFRPETDIVHGKD